ncbi:MAG: hypothetical protein FJ100_02555, partial [Deltaproteobacteria bacterium]|nr:hypothetical protein [Deltaproteobacteria bacterium]
MTAAALRFRALACVLAAAAIACASESSNPAGQGASTGTGTGGGGTNRNNPGGGSGTIATDDDQTIAVREGGKPVSNGAKLAIATGDLGEGGTTTRVMQVQNNASFKALTVSKLAFDYQPTPVEADKPAFTCVVVKDNAETPCKDFAGMTLHPVGKGINSFSINIRFLKYNDAVTRSAVLRVQSNDVKGNKEFAVTFATTAGLAKIAVQPAQIDFGYVPVGTSPVAAGVVLNVGSADLVISQVE